MERAPEHLIVLPKPTTAKVEVCGVQWEEMEAHFYDESIRPVSLVIHRLDEPQLILNEQGDRRALFHDWQMVRGVWRTPIGFMYRWVEVNLGHTCWGFQDIYKASNAETWDLWEFVKECASHGVSVAVGDRWFVAVRDVPWEFRERIGVYDSRGNRRRTLVDWIAANPQAKRVTMAEALAIIREEAA